MKPLGIRSRILLAALAPAVLVALLITGVLLVEQAKQSHIEQHRRLAALARQLATAAEYDLFVGGVDSLRKLLLAATSEPDVHAAAILDTAGNVLAATLPHAQLPPPDGVIVGFAPPVDAEPLMHWHLQPIRAASHAESDLFAVPQSQEPPPLGQLLLQVSNQSLNDEMRRAAGYAALAAALVLLFAAVLALALSRGLIRMLGSIGSVVAGIGQGRTHLRVAGAGQDELGHLAAGINEMAGAVAQNQEELAARIAKATATLRHERDEAEAATQSRSRFFAAASHDLRQPVQALGLFVDHLERDAHASPLLPQVNKLAQTVASLQSLLDMLLDYSRLDGKVYRVERRPVRVADVVDHLIDDFAAAAAAKELVLRTRTVDCWAMTDPALLHRVLLNFLGNAVRHTRHGGILVAVRCNAMAVRIEVWDTGPGIPAAEHEAIFEELFQLDNPERDPAKGMGLGLAIVRRTAALLEHPVQLCSRVGHGSRFSITLPKVPAPAAAEAATQAADDPLAGAHILLLSDPPGESAELFDLLAGWGAAVTRGASVAAAEEWIVRCGPPAVLIWDMQPSSPGTTEAQAALDRLTGAAGRPLPALIISPGPVPALAEQPGAAPRLLLPRPFRPARLRALLTHLLTAHAD
ncbi:MAG: ATP-binding protein [Rhodocyclaceae bacterium]|nr:ATP-binding protein [Rhodocyclaceae bacterium]